MATVAAGLLGMACAELLGLAPLEEGPDSVDASSTDSGSSTSDGGDGGVDHCANEKMDLDETDIDCGGSCGKCAKGQKCKIDADCAKTCVVVDGGPNVCGGCAGVKMLDAGEACIDSTEVHVRDYDAFLKKGVARVEDERCDRNPKALLQIPDNFTEQLKSPDHPVRRVGWCAAKAYCKSRGQKLCGAFTAGRLSLADFNDSSKDQWMAACTGLNRTEYPYNADYDPKRCNGLDKQLGAPWDAGGVLDCKTLGEPFNVFDMSGNVAEWEDACGTSDNRDQCLVRGGSYRSDGGGLKCSALDVRPPTNSTDDVGFRCCE